MVRLRNLAVVALVVVVLQVALGALPASASTPWPLGTLTIQKGVVPPCLTGYTCQAFKVDRCTGVSLSATGTLAAGRPSTTARGMVLFFSGSDGTDWWSNGSALTVSFLQGLQALGFWIVQVRWRDPWLLAAPGEDAGSAHMACRPATVVQWISTNVYVPLGIQAQPEQCGFCITGNSGGSGQVTYPLSFYGLDSILGAVIPTSGPTHTALTNGCLRMAEEQHYWFSDSESISIDSSFGFNRQAGACLNHDASYSSRWDAESLETGGNRFVYPTTRVVILVGANDCGDSPAHAAAFYDTISAAGTPYASLGVIANMSHSIQASSTGLTELQDALLGLPIGNIGAPCYPI